MKRIVVAFKPEAGQSDIEKLLGQYTHDKILDIEYDPAADRIKQMLARSYILYVPKNKEAEILEELKDNYKILVEFAGLPNQRKAMKQ